MKRSIVYITSESLILLFDVVLLYINTFYLQADASEELSM